MILSIIVSLEDSLALEDQIARKMLTIKSNVTTENGSDPSNKRTKAESVDGPDLYGEFVKKFLPILPRTFKSLLDPSINIESDKPRELIEFLGNLLGITHYATNMSSFWFLDTLALQMLRFKGDLDEYHMGVLITWLTGEIRLLQDRKCTREQFFREMKNIFILAANKISEQKQLLHWNKIMIEHDTEEEMEEKLSTGNESMKSLQKRFSQKNVEPSSNMDPALALDIVIDATYDMYGNELRYALVYAVFVESIEVESYNLPFTLRTPRPVKLADSKMVPFNMELQRSLRRSKTMETSKKSNKKAKGKKTKTNLRVPAPPPPSLDDERMLMFNRSFILPLIKANEASEMFERDTNDA